MNRAYYIVLIPVLLVVAGYVAVFRTMGIGLPWLQLLAPLALLVTAKWWLARSARAAMMALHLSGMVFRRKWQPPQLALWEGPFADPAQRLPQHPGVAAERREEKRRYRLRQAMRAREAATLAAERGRDDDIAA